MLDQKKKKLMLHQLRKMSQKVQHMTCLLVLINNSTSSLYSLGRPLPADTVQTGGAWIPKMQTKKLCYKKILIEKPSTDKV